MISYTQFQLAEKINLIFVTNNDIYAISIGREVKLHIRQRTLSYMSFWSVRKSIRIFFDERLWFRSVRKSIRIHFDERHEFRTIEKSKPICIKKDIVYAIWTGWEPNLIFVNERYHTSKVGNPTSCSWTNDDIFAVSFDRVKHFHVHQRRSQSQLQSMKKSYVLDDLTVAAFCFICVVLIDRSISCNEDNLNDWCASCASCASCIWRFTSMTLHIYGASYIWRFRFNQCASCGKCDNCFAAFNNFNFNYISTMMMIFFNNFISYEIVCNIQLH